MTDHSSYSCPQVVLASPMHAAAFIAHISEATQKHADLVISYLDHPGDRSEWVEFDCPNPSCTKKVVASPNSAIMQRVCSSACALALMT